MNNLIRNYKIILKELKQTCKNISTSKQIRRPKLSDMELVALNITAEYMSINSELQLFRCIFGTELEVKIERSVYNRRKRKLFSYIEKIRKTLSKKFSDFTDVFIVDSTPIAICKISRANRSAICSTEQIQPSFGYCASQKSNFLDINFICFAIEMESSIPLILRPPISMMLTILKISKKTFKTV